MTRLEDSFRGAKLQNVSVTGNSIGRIPIGIFNGTGLHALFLSDNAIIRIQAEAFQDMQKLTFLTLRSNKIDNFNGKILLGNTNLEFLDLSNNKIYQIHSDTFSTLSNVKTILLDNNVIEIISPQAFSELSALKTLSLSHNHLIEFQPAVLAHYHSSLRQLYLNFNNLTFLSPKVLTQVPDLEEISVHGNPWQCPCWYRLRQDITERGIKEAMYRCIEKSHPKESFNDGKLPRCVVHSAFDDDCEEDVKYAREFSKIYSSSLAEYDKRILCPEFLVFEILFKLFFIPEEIKDL